MDWQLFSKLFIKCEQTVFVTIIMSVLILERIFGISVYTLFLTPLGVTSLIVLVILLAVSEVIDRRQNNEFVLTTS